MKDSESEILKQFKEKVKDVEEDEATCIRFLKARDFNISIAEELLRNNIIWRKEIGIENYLTFTLPPTMSKDFEYSVKGINHNGGPVIWIPLGRWNGRYWIEKGQGEEVRRMGYHILESALVRMKELGNNPCVIILGMETLTYYKTAHIQTLRQTYDSFHILEKNYPEIIHSLIVINAPWVFSIGFSFIKPILSQNTLSKIQVFGAEKDKWLPALRKLIPDSSIPSDYLEDSNSNNK